MTPAPSTVTLARCARRWHRISRLQHRLHQVAVGYATIESQLLPRATSLVNMVAFERQMQALERLIAAESTRATILLLELDLQLKRKKGAR